MQIRCPVCDYSREVNLEKIPPSAEFATCPKCRHRFRFRAVDLDAVEQPPAPPAPDPGHGDVWDAMDSLRDRWAERDQAAENGDDTEPAYDQAAPADSSVPWETPRQLGYWRSFSRTTLWILFQPSSFFASLSKRAALLPALAYFIIFGVFQYVFSVLWTPTVMNMMRDRFIAVMGEEAFTHMAENLVTNSLFGSAILFVPFQFTIQIFLLAGILHLLVRVASPRTADFTLTFKVVGYAAAGYILAIVPAAGMFIAPVWFFALLLIGCRHAFSMSWNRVALTLLPLVMLLLLLTLASANAVRSAIAG